MARSMGTTSADTGSSSGMATLATYDHYDDARLAVDHLSDRGFDVSRIAIIWHRLRRVEQVTGRRTIATAAGQGALAGAWFGAFLGLLLALFTDLDSAGELIVAIGVYLVVGALVGALWWGAMHWTTGGRRDYSAVGLLEAERYEVVTAPELLAEARDLLGLGGRLTDDVAEDLRRPTADTDEHR